MKRRLKKTASGITLHNSNPAAIEEVLVGEMKEALGQWSNVAKIKPFLRIEDDDADLSGNVKNAFGAIQITVYNVNLFIPFIISDKTLLPFDTIRMGEEEISYDYAKLRRIVNAIEHKAKSAQEGSGDGFDTMEIAKFEDVQPNNGFLGTIMQIRDSHQAKNINGESPWSGAGFGNMDDERILKAASVDVFDGFHNVMEKIANVNIYSKEQLEAYENDLLEIEKKAFEEELEKVAEIKETLSEAKEKRDMIKLSEEKLFNVHRAASGNNIAYPTFEEGRFEYRLGRVYRQFESLIKRDRFYKPGKIDALVVDTKGGYSVLKKNQPFMASTRDPGEIEFKTEVSRGLLTGHMYATEKDTTTLYHPFIVEETFLQGVLNDGIVVSVRERSEQDIAERTKNTLFKDSLLCQEVIPGTEKHSGMAISGQTTRMIISKDASINEMKYMDEGELNLYITQHATDPSDARLAKDMASYSSTYLLVPENYEFFELTHNIKNYYTRPDGLFIEGPMAKTAAYAGQNKATLIVKKDRSPKVYDLKWQFTEENDVDGAKATKIERRSVEDLSVDQAKAMLGKLGFDHRTQAKFFEISTRNGRSATFDLPNPRIAGKVAGPDLATDKVKKKMKGLADSMLNSRNFVPLFADTISSGVSEVLSATVPSTVGAAHKINDFFDDKIAMDTAIKVEKLATSLDGPTWHELSALLNMKYHLDKLASEIKNGSYLHNGEEVFEEVSTFKNTIEKTAKELVGFNRKQLTHHDKYLVEPSLVKEAIHQLDGLYVYATSDVKKKAQ